MAKAKQEKVTHRYKNRVREFIAEFPTAELIEHPENWRVHPETQKRMLRSLMGRHGKIDAILCYDSEKYGGRVIIDGHQRSGMDDVYPVLVLDVNDAEAKEILLTYNPLAEMSQTNQDQVRALASQMQDMQAEEKRTVDEILSSVLRVSVADDSPANKAVLENVEVKAPPKMIWTVIGVPIGEYGAVAGTVEKMSRIPGVIVESTASDFSPKDK
jgi:hypothetical protein